MEAEHGGFLEGDLFGGSGYPGRLPVEPHLEVGFQVDDGVPRGFDPMNIGDERKREREEER